MNESLPDHSDEKAYRIAYLIAGYIRKILTIEEHDELDDWVAASDENMRLFEDLTNEDHIAANLAWMDKVQTEKALKQTMARLSFEPATRVIKQKRRWPGLIAASLLLAIAAFFIFRKNGTTSHNLATNSNATMDILPGGNRATLTFSDGSVTDLAKINNGTIRQENGATIQKNAEGELRYEKTNASDATVFNTLTTPKGGQFALTLSDGTRVWLNAQSSLRYPVQFGDSIREVELNGEAYFEVAKNKLQPFIVRLAPGEAVKVLGTEFNIMAYAAEAAKKITLVEGSVQVRATAGQLQLKPGQQALLKQDLLSLQPNADVDAATGWKKGVFSFHEAEIYELMRQVERWYDVDVIYKTTTTEHFNAIISRKETVSKLLQLLELTGKIHFKIENKTIYVLP
jgi:ferric-dicitrate binding protein FerR (iron transport regulator)